MVERADRATVGTFYAPEQWGGTLDLGEPAARHASVKRLKPGDSIRLTGGDGRRANGTIESLGKQRLRVAVDEGSLVTTPAPAHVELWAPIGDRERMLLLAEKSVELCVSAWRPVMYRRSRSVSPRGEGDAFRQKLLSRMIGALEQSGGAWLPTVHRDVALEEALRGASAGGGVLMDQAGEPLQSVAMTLRAPIAIALGPEGGLEADERARFLHGGWRPASLGPNVLRFETAGIAALALVRSITL